MVLIGFQKYLRKMIRLLIYLVTISNWTTSAGTIYPQF